MNAVTVPPHLAELIRQGAVQWLTFPTDQRELVGRSLAIVAGGAEPWEHGPWEARRTRSGWYLFDRPDTSVSHPLVERAVVASATVTDVVPISDDWWTTGEGHYDISDHLPFLDWSPGRWAVRLDGVRPLERGVAEPDGPGLNCCHCTRPLYRVRSMLSDTGWRHIDGSARCRIIPADPGPLGTIWEWTP